MAVRHQRINWNQVYYFSEVARSGSLKSVAEALALSPSTLSEHIAELEKSLNVQLFHREHRRLRLTEQGTQLHHVTKQVFESGQRFLDVLSPLPLGTYPISVGLVPSSSIQVGYHLIGDYVKRFGPVDVRVVQATHNELEDGLSRAELDFGVTDRLPARKDINSHLLCSSPLSFYVARDWERMTFADAVAKLPLLICSSDPSHPSTVRQFLEEAEISIHSTITSAFPSMLMELCQKGIGIGVFGEEVVKEFNQGAFRLLRAPKDAPKLFEKLYLLWARGSENAAVVQYLKEHLSIG